MRFSLFSKPKRCGESQIDTRTLVLVYVFLAFMVIMAFVSLPYSHSGSKNTDKNVRRLNSLQSEFLSRIIFETPYRTNVLAIIDEKNALSDFVDSAHDVRRDDFGTLTYKRKGPGQVWWVFVELNDGQELKLEWVHHDSSPSDVRGMFIETTANSMSNHGEFVSTNLRQWFSKHVEYQLNSVKFEL